MYFCVILRYPLLGFRVCRNYAGLLSSAMSMTFASQLCVWRHESLNVSRMLQLMKSGRSVRCRYVHVGTLNPPPRPQTHLLMSFMGYLGICWYSWHPCRSYMHNSSFNSETSRFWTQFVANVVKNTISNSS